jgi:hypothetical protein
VEDRDPEIAQLRQKLEATHRELTATRVERDSLTRKLEEAKSGNGGPAAVTIMAGMPTSAKQGKAASPAKPAAAKAAKTTKSPPSPAKALETPKKGQVMAATGGQKTPGGGGAVRAGQKTVNMPEANRPNPFTEPSFNPIAIDPMAMQNTHTVAAHSAPISSLCVHPRRPIAVTVSDDMVWKMWRLPESDVVMSGDGHRDWVSDC